MTVNSPKRLIFSWKVSSESGFDILRLPLDGEDAVPKMSGPPAGRAGVVGSVSVPLSAGEGLDEMPHLVVEIGRVVQRLRDLGAGDVAEAAAQTMNRHFQRAFAETELGGRVGLRGA